MAFFVEKTIKATIIRHPADLWSERSLQGNKSPDWRFLKGLYAELNKLLALPCLSWTDAPGKNSKQKPLPQTVPVLLKQVVSKPGRGVPARRGRQARLCPYPLFFPVYGGLTKTLTKA
jgi:hypothetical protein